MKGICVGFSREVEQPALRELVAALELTSETERFEGSLHYVTDGDGPSVPEIWRPMGPLRGQCSPILMIEGVRFLLGDLRVVRVRVYRHRD